MKKFKLHLFFVLLILPLSLNAQSGEELRLLGAGDLTAGRFEAALESYQRAAQLLEGLPAQKCLLKTLQIRFELGSYENLPEESHKLVLSGLDLSVKRDAVILEIHSLIRLKEDSRAVILMEEYTSLLLEEPSSAMRLSDAYEEMAYWDEATRIQWIIKRDFPESPEALILSGQAERRAKPSLLLSTS
jgi:tetratricopeptide (TPR) repeat protein